MKLPNSVEKRKKVLASLKASRGFLNSNAGISSLAVRRNEAFVHEVTKIDLAVTVQEKLEQTILSHNRPELVGHLTTGRRVGTDLFLKLVRRWRMECGRLHPRNACPQRAARRFEYLLALEFGNRPNGSDKGHLHGHILIWNVGRVSIRNLKTQWRKVTSARVGPVIQKYKPRMRGVGYALKTLHTDADLITFSPRVVLYMTTLTHFRAIGRQR
ncbi:MAG: hypothetical protein JWO19_1936 [Bryobacterales bacterium]|nr:hypothetical protein [Bryobacterales bacterium]